MESNPALPCILGIGCVVPGPGVLDIHILISCMPRLPFLHSSFSSFLSVHTGAPQGAIMDVMISDMELNDKKAKLFAKIGEASGIDRRYSVLPSIEAIYFGRKGLGNDGQHTAAWRWDEQTGMK